MSLTPTRAGLVRQSLGAREAGLAYLANDEQVHDAVRRGALVTMSGNDDYDIHPDVRHTAARPEVKLFVERLAQQYRATCGEKLVVTSLVRPRDHQPWNSDPLSVHPTGMAVDMHISGSWSCRRFIESALLDLEARGVVEAAREHAIPHYHVVVFPQPYLAYLARSGVSVPAAAPLANDVVLARLAGPDPFVVPALLGAQLAAMTPAEPIGTTVAAVSRATPAAPAVEKATRAVARESVRSRTVATRHTRSRHAVTRSRHGRGRTTSHVSARRYRVRNGETLWSIARTHGVSVASIERANRLPAHRIRPGQVLLLPAR